MKYGNPGVQRAILVILLFLVGQPGAMALDANLVSNEITLVLGPNGAVTTFYKIEWNVTSGTMGAFYFEGEAYQPAWDMERCYLDLASRERLPITITPVGGNNKYDIVVANGRRYSGRGWFVLTYGGDFAELGLVGRTTSPDFGELVYFNWAPVVRPTSPSSAKSPPWSTGRCGWCCPLRSAARP